MGMVNFGDVSSANYANSHRVHAAILGTGYIDLGIHDFANVMSQGDAITGASPTCTKWRLCLKMLG